MPLNAPNDEGMPPSKKFPSSRSDSSTRHSPRLLGIFPDMRQLIPRQINVFQVSHAPHFRWNRPC
jgi:hypothetical protein